MTLFGYHCSHEQHSPRALLDYVQQAERAGFRGCMAADHFHPWLPENGHSGFVWSWLGAALQATSLPFGTVNAPGDRYHPAIIAQAAATLAEIFPDRFWLALGSGEAVNEHITGNDWPPKERREARLRECVDVMRALWRGETVTHRGLIDVVEARVYSLPETPPRIMGAAVSEATAHWVGGWADGLITTGRPRDDMQKLIAAFRAGGGDGKPIAVQHTLSWARTDAEARRAAHEQWRFTAITDHEKLWNLRTPGAFAAETRSLSVDDVAARIPSFSDLARHRQLLQDYVALDVDEVYIFNVGRNQPEFIDVFGAEVLPALAGDESRAG